MKKFIAIYVMLLLSCSSQKNEINKIVENDDVHFPIECVDLKSIEIYKNADWLIFEIKVQELRDTISYSDNNFYNFFVTSKLNDSTELQLAIWNPESDSIERRKLITKYLLENCSIKFNKVVRGSDHKITVYPLDSVFTSLNENGRMCFKVKPTILNDTLIKSFKNNLSIQTQYCRKTPSCTNTCYIDYLKTNPNEFDKRGLDTSICH